MKQVPAHVPEQLERRIDDLSRRHGLKKSHIIEQALAHYVAALEELPLSAIVAPVLTVGPADFDRLAGGGAIPPSLRSWS